MMENFLMNYSIVMKNIVINTFISIIILNNICIKKKQKKKKKKKKKII